MKSKLSYTMSVFLKPQYVAVTYCYLGFERLNMNWTVIRTDGWLKVKWSLSLIYPRKDYITVIKLFVWFNRPFHTFSCICDWNSPHWTRFSYYDVDVGGGLSMSLSLCLLFMDYTVSLYNYLWHLNVKINIKTTTQRLNRRWSCFILYRLKNTQGTVKATCDYIIHSRWCRSGMVTVKAATVEW